MEVSGISNVLLLPVLKKEEPKATPGTATPTYPSGLSHRGRYTLKKVEFGLFFFLLY